jgi:hypothetical protein
MEHYYSSKLIYSRRVPPPRVDNSVVDILQHRPKSLLSMSNSASTTMTVIIVAR